MRNSKGKDHIEIASDADAVQYFKRLARYSEHSTMVYSSRHKRAMKMCEVNQLILEEHYESYI